MAFTFRTYPIGGDTIDLSASPPAANELLLVYSVTDTTTTTGAGPGAGWTQLGGAWQVNTSNEQSSSVWWKKAVGGETSIAMDVANTAINSCIAIGGVDVTTPLDGVTPVIVNSNTNSASPRALSGSIAPITDGALIVGIAATDTGGSVDATTTFSGGGLTWTTRQDQNDSSPRNIAVGSAVQATHASASVQASSTFASGNAGMTLFLLAIRLSGATPPANGPNHIQIGMAARPF